MEKFSKERVPDVSLAAKAKVQRLHFDRVPDTRTQFWGQQERKTESGTVRENLPEESKRGVVYRDVRIRLKIIGENTGPEQSRGEDKPGVHESDKSG